MILRALLSLGLVAATSLARAEAVPELYRRSYALEAAGSPAAALAAMDAMEPAQAADYVFNLRRGWLLYLGGRYAEAVAAYGKAIDLEPRAVEPRLGQMLPLMAARRWREVERQGAEVLTIMPGEFTALSRLAFAAYSQGRFTEAEGLYRRALAAFPASVEMRAGLGWTLLKLARPREARVELTRALQVAPDHASASQGLALVP